MEREIRRNTVIMLIYMMFLFMLMMISMEEKFDTLETKIEKLKP